VFKKAIFLKMLCTFYRKTQNKNIEEFTLK